MPPIIDLLVEFGWTVTIQQAPATGERHSAAGALVLARLWAARTQALQVRSHVKLLRLTVLRQASLPAHEMASMIYLLSHGKAEDDGKGHQGAIACGWARE
jgi:hypothetical protein